MKDKRSKTNDAKVDYLHPVGDAPERKRTTNEEAANEKGAEVY